jgi:hypothetical protein
MTADTKSDPGEYYTSRRSRARRAEHRRWDRRTQVAVLILAVVVGIVAGRLGTHRSWERPATTPFSGVHPAVVHRP